jgi:hypothetical protein
LHAKILYPRQLRSKVVWVAPKVAASAEEPVEFHHQSRKMGVVPGDAVTPALPQENTDFAEAS